MHKLLKTLLLSGCLTAASAAVASPGPYEFKSVPHAELIEHLVPGSDATDTPAPLQGLWWMDGNPLPDEVVSFAGTKFEALKEDGVVVGYEAYAPVYDEGVWSWHDSREGKLLYGAVKKFKLVYHIVFNADFTQGEVTPTLDLLPGPLKSEIPQSMLLKFSMKQVSPVEYSRDSIIAGRPSAYRFRQIVDAQGQLLPAYDDYLKSVADRNLPNALLPVCTRSNPERTLPTPCAFR